MEFSGTQEQWNKKCADQPHTQFLQSYEWGQFQRALGRQVWYVVGGISNESAQCLVIKYPLAGSFFYLMCPRGPVGTPSDKWWHEFQVWSGGQGALFARVEPMVSINEVGFTKVRDIQPAVTRIIDLSMDEDHLLSVMHPKTRYNINLAQKKGVEITKTSFGAILESHIQKWWTLSRQTAQRNRISVYSYEYYKTLFNTFPYLSLSCATWKSKLIAMTVNVSFGDTVCYLYGASSQEYKEVMAPYFLQWDAIKTAKKDGYRYYDLWGVAPNDDARHPLVGVTRFKKGFGGGVMSYPGTLDIPFKKTQYRLYSFIRNIRRLL